MKSQLPPGHLLLLILAGWINRRQQDAVEYLLTENQILGRSSERNEFSSTTASDAGLPS
jgi:hypothetical protein